LVSILKLRDQFGINHFAYNQGTLIKGLLESMAEVDENFSSGRKISKSIFVSTTAIIFLEPPRGIGQCWKGGLGSLKRHRPGAFFGLVFE
jgi:hypothetical protein